MTLQFIQHYKSHDVASHMMLQHISHMTPQGYMMIGYVNHIGRDSSTECTGDQWDVPA